MIHCPNCSKEKMITIFKKRMPYLFCNNCRCFALQGRTLKKALDIQVLTNLKNSIHELKNSINRNCPFCLNHLKAWKVKTKNSKIIELDSCPRCYFSLFDPKEILELDFSNYKEVPKQHDSSLEIVGFQKGFSPDGGQQILFDYPNLENLKTNKIHSKKLFQPITWLTVISLGLLHKIDLIKIISKVDYQWLKITLASFYHSNNNYLIAIITYLLIYLNKLERFFGAKVILQLYLLSFLTNIMIYFFYSKTILIGLSSFITVILGYFSSLFPDTSISYFKYFAGGKIRIVIPYLIYALLSLFFLISIHFRFLGFDKIKIILITHCILFLVGYLFPILEDIADNQNKE